jgi:hypothetical protein
MSDIKLPFLMSQEVKDLFTEIGVKPPKESSITLVTLSEGIGEERRIYYLDADKIVQGIRENFKSYYPFDLSVANSAQHLTDGRLGHLYTNKNGVFKDAAALFLSTHYFHQIKPGRFIKKLIPDVEDKLAEKFAASVLKGIEIKVVDDVTAIYAYDPPHSCMSKSDMSFYEKNGIKIAAGFLKDQLVCRALIWPEIKFPKLNKTLTYMDRQYDKDGRFFRLLRLFAKSQGMVFRERSGEAEGGDDEKTRTTFTYNEMTFKDYIQFRIKDYRLSFIPWQDTFCFADKREGIVTLNNKGGSFYLRYCDGRNPLHVVMVFCKYLNKEIPKKDAISLDYINDWGCTEDVYSLEDGNFLKTDCVVCLSCQTNYYKQSYKIHLSVDGKTICKNCGVEITGGTYKGLWARPSDTVHVGTKIVYKDDDAIIEIKGKSALKTESGVYKNWILPTSAWRFVSVGNDPQNTVSGHWEICNTHNYYFDTQTGQLF